MELQRDTVQNVCILLSKAMEPLSLMSSLLARILVSVQSLEKRCYTGTQDAEAARFVKNFIFKDQRI